MVVIDEAINQLMGLPLTDGLIDGIAIVLISGLIAAFLSPPFFLSKAAIALLCPFTPKARPSEDGLFFEMLEDAEALAAADLGYFWQRWSHDLDVLLGVMNLLWLDVGERMTLWFFK
ncbi:MAG: hypothetical protein HC919_06040 [Oscillatoriales cyanobacterium SM2_2_1]|nr:hypothetical protein [Oscillatoriales cyanobacterium SM2_2_1]